VRPGGLGGKQLLQLAVLRHLGRGEPSEHKAPDLLPTCTVLRETDYVSFVG
jgi:hypothetical protein